MGTPMFAIAAILVLVAVVSAPLCLLWIALTNRRLRRTTNPQILRKLNKLDG
jgi:ABC-type bacteriocin/lantibiotic exporter with double-glycine peptidase domain